MQESYLVPVRPIKIGKDPETGRPGKDVPLGGGALGHHLGG